MPIEWEAELTRLRGNDARLRKVLRELIECIDLAEANGDLPVSLAGYGHAYIERAKTELAQS